MKKMNAKIYSNTQLIGTADLSLTDESRAVVAGKFCPTKNFEAIKKVVLNFHNSNANERFNLLKHLRLNALLENDIFLFPTGGFLFTDLDHFPKGKIEFKAVGNYRHVVEDYFLTTSPKQNIAEPWEFISIEQKLGYEDELAKEIGANSKQGIFNIFNRKQHRLRGFTFCAIAKYCSNDDVLFALHKKGANPFEYAVIHLTWKGKIEENDVFPQTQFFESFDQFLNQRMHPDK